MPHRTTDQIIDSLIRCGYVRRIEIEVWRRSQAGETIFSIRRDFPKSGPGTTWSQSTLYLWVQKVNAAIRDQRMIERREDADLRYGVTVASGSRTRSTGDPTAAGRRPDEQSSWNEEEMKRYGVLDRWSRKR